MPKFWNIWCVVRHDRSQASDHYLNFVRFWSLLSCPFLPPLFLVGMVLLDFLLGMVLFDMCFLDEGVCALPRVLSLDSIIRVFSCSVANSCDAFKCLYEDFKFVCNAFYFGKEERDNWYFV